MIVAFYRQTNGDATKNHGGVIQLATSSFYMFLSRWMEKNLKCKVASSFSILPIVVLLFSKA